jgi:hypothetical protein
VNAAFASGGGVCAVNKEAIVRAATELASMASRPFPLRLLCERGC